MERKWFMVEDLSNVQPEQAIQAVALLRLLIDTMDQVAIDQTSVTVRIRLNELLLIALDEWCDAVELAA